MSVTLASWIMGLLGLYFVLGILFVVPFLLKGMRRIDPATDGGSIGFRLIIVPGIIALWPLLAKRWLTGSTEPPQESNPHRDKTR